MIIKLLLFLSIFLIGVKYSEQGSDEVKLHQYLFSASENGTAYNPLMRPIKDPNQRIKVDVVVGIKRLFEMDEINHKVTLFAIFIKTWKDEFLKWDPKDFNNIEYTYVSYNQIWTPHLQLVSKFLTTESSTDYNIHEIYDNYPIKLWYNGSVQFTPSLHLNTECLFSYARFPFDFQLCSFRFQAPYSMRQIDFSFSSYYTKEYHKYDQIWQIEDVKWLPSTSQDRYPVNFLRVDFRRTVRNYLFTMPSYIVYMLTLLMFVLPQTSNQRILIGSTCLIIATLLAYTMTANLPHTDISAWPILGKMYLFNIVLLTFSLIFSTFIINVSSRDHLKSVPDWLRKFTLNVLAKIFCIQAIAYTVFNSYSFKSQDDESMVVQEHIASQVVMSEIDPEVTIRDRNNASNINGGNYSSGGLIVGEDMAYEKLTSSRVETANNTTSSLNSSMAQEASMTRPTRLNSDSSSKMTLTRLLKNIYDHMEQIRYRLQRDTYKRCVNNEWLLVGTLIDKILFFVYCSIVIFCTLSIFKNN